MTEEEKAISENMREAADPANAPSPGEIPPRGQAGAGGSQSGQALETAGRDFTKDASYARLRREGEAAREENRRLLERLRERDASYGEGKMAERGAGPTPSSPAPAGEEGENLLGRLREENQALRQRERERIFADDLSAIKRSYPEERLRTVFDLGDEFVRLRAAGVDTLTAFDAIRSRREREARIRPPSTGSVKSNTSPRQEYFTERELDRLTKKDLDNPRILEKALASMAKLR